MTLQTAEPLPTRIRRWRRALHSGTDKAKKAAPAAFLISGAGLGLWLSVGTGSLVFILISTVLGTMLGGGVLLVGRFVASNLSTIIMGGVGFVAAVLLWIAAIVFGAGFIVATFQLLISGIRAVLGI